MRSRLVGVLATLGMVAIIVNRWRAIWSQLMEWTREGEVEQQRLIRERETRERREANPWGERARLHRLRAADLRVELAELRERAQRRALDPFGRRIRRSPRRRKPPPGPGGGSGAPP